MGQRDKELQESYDRVAEEYTQRYFEELRHKPLDREILNRFAEKVRRLGPVCDLGCGPGQIARYLHERGVDAFGLDVSPKMVEVARRQSPDLVFRQADMMSLDLPNGSLGGIAAFYSIIHIPRDRVIRALNEIKRVLQPGGWLLLSFHIGEETMHIEELWGEKVSMDFFFFTKKEMEAYFRSSGLEIKEMIERPPYPDVEYQSQRAYFLAKKNR